jgi:uncharacterized protein (DUF58 family)
VKRWSGGAAAIVLLTGAAGVTAAWLFGLPELAALAVAGTAAALLGALRLHRSAAPAVDLSIQPAVVHVGEPASLVVRVHNPRRRRSSPATVHGRLGTAGDGILAITSLGPGRSTEPVVTLPTLRRGLVRIDGLRCTITDPLGWWARTSATGAHATLVVRPRVHPLRAEALGVGHLHAATGARGRGHGGSVEDELVGLRPYLRGDDLRLIHWRTSARRLHPHVVQVEPPARSAAVVVLVDTRAEGQESTEFERAVEAAASIVVHFAGDGHPVRLLTADGWDSGPTEPAAVGDLLDALSAVDRRHGTRLDRALQAAGAADTAAVVLCTAAAVPLHVDLDREEARLTVLSCGSGEVRTAGAVVRWHAGASLAACWERDHGAPTMADAPGAPPTSTGRGPFSKGREAAHPETDP